MHPMNCTCPSCQFGRTGEFELEYRSSETGELSEQEELELAMELLSVNNEYEMEQFLGNLVSSIGRGLKSVGRIALPALRSLAKFALPIAGRALGSFIPIPGVGTMIGERTRSRSRQRARIGVTPVWIPDRLTSRKRAELCAFSEAPFGIYPRRLDPCRRNRPYARR